MADLAMDGERLRTIRLYGKLGASFGRVHKFVCNDTAGAIRALCQMIPGFQKFLNESKDNGLAYSCFIGKQNIDADGLNYPPGDEDIRIAPVIIGSGRGGLFQVILGAALIAGSFVPGLNVALWSGASSMFLGMGAAMVLGGVASMLTKQATGLTSVDSPDNGASYQFNGPVNVTAQGNPVPVLYGEAIVGSVTISADMYAEDLQ